MGLWHRLVGSRSPGRGARGSSTRRLRHYNPLILAFPELVEIDKREVDDQTKEMNETKEINKTEVSDETKEWDEDKVVDMDMTKTLHTIATEIQAFLELLLMILLVGALVVEVDDLDVDYCRSPLNHI